jgi:hypothetical protein
MGTIIGIIIGLAGLGLGLWLVLWGGRRAISSVG